ncbi:MAG: N-acetylglucosamine-6-phosphate deacetylase [Armatimonadota bacterium]
MPQCPSCDADYSLGDNVCRACGAELPAPYELWTEGEEGEATAPGQPARLIPSVGQQTDASLLPPGSTILAGATLMLEDMVIDNGSVVIADGRIIDIREDTLPDPGTGATYLDLTGSLLSAGFIDVHIHGMMGLDTNAASADDFHRISAEAAARGVTAMVPTTVACSAEELRRTLVNVKTAVTSGVPGARLLGLHLESNFISPEFKGAQPIEYIIPPTDPGATAILDILDEFAQYIRIITLAPEVPGAMGLIPWLRERGIIVSLGHSAATYDEAVAGFDAGANHVTHLFNAMRPLHHRNPGLVGAALERDDVFTEMVCDGFHIHPAVITAAILAKGVGHFVPISDGLAGAGMTSGEFIFTGRTVSTDSGVAKLPDGTIAGSITTMDRIVRFLVDKVGWELNEALTMASTTPADALGLDITGRLAIGAAADLTILSPELEVRMTLVDGKVVYK